MKRGLLGQGLAAAVCAAALSWMQSGCTTDAFCFDNCEGATSGLTDGGGGDTGTGGSGGTLIIDSGTGGVVNPDASDATGPCVITNGGSEICDGLDNDCNGVVDDGFDMHDKAHCGTCDNNCVTAMINADPDAVTCTWDGTPNKPGTCGFTACSQDWYDIDGDPANGCEYACVWAAADDSSCNKRDDDCDGLIDEDVDLCTSVTDCGQCSNACVVLHGTPECVHTGAAACDSTNTKCAIATCDTDWWDLDKSYATGCEYHCTPTNGGVEICGDGLDNDCDGKIDGADDDLSGDPQLGKPCFGDPDGICATAAHAGATVCVGQKVECQGANVIVQGQVPETCNGLDDDCNGIVDDNLTDVGKSCGTSNIFPCSLGSEQCVNGALACVGAVDPGVEYCNGLDDDCDGVIDNNTVDAVGTCGQSNVGECKLGNKTCTGGVVLCVGNVDAKTETCNGKDDDCDGVVDNNPTDVGGTCGQSNTEPCKFGTMECVNGAATCVGATNPQAETCNGIDDNCDGIIDNGVPGAGVSCGLNDTFPCKKGSMQCQGGAMVCVGAVDPKIETCNGVDDDCNGVIDDNTTDSGGNCGQSNTAPCKFGKLTCQNGQLACVGNVDPTPETCDGKDNDCNGVVDNNPSGINADCGQSNTAPCKYGKTACQNGSLTCVGAVNPTTETCNGIDDNCNGVVDDSPTGAGVSCGTTNVFPCSYGTMQCQSGTLKCVGAVNPGTETCNGVDDDCDGKIDLTGTTPPPDSVGACDVPPPPPAGATSPCKAGTKACQGGVVVCQGSVVAVPGAQDTCKVDANCDGVLTNQPNLQTDVHNCGACGNDCTAGAHHSNWACVTGACVFQGCTPGYYDNGGPPDAVAGDHLCDYGCTFISAQEACNGVDDNCNGQIDENVTKPSPTQVCGVSPSAVRPECTSQVTVTCTAGKWVCGFPAGVCTTGCSTTTEICDLLDNNCNGLLNENTPNYGQACASDDGLPPPGDGICRTTGTYVCNGTTATKCSAVKDMSKAGPELCDGVDNDCDGSVDETFNNKGSNATYFVKPTVTKLASLWIYTYEASRPSATTTAPGSGNGYWTSAPTGQTLDQTRACSVDSKVPWFNVTGTEVEQTCAALGGRVCTTLEWQSACQATVGCTWGYAPRGATCTSGYTGSKYCNLGPSYDFDKVAAGIQDGLLPTASNLLQSCWADWSGTSGNTAATVKLFDITGNLREIVKEGTNDYRLMGGAFDTSAEAGAACSFKFYSVDANYKFFDTGFRCCFTSDPTQ